MPADSVASTPTAGERELQRLASVIASALGAPGAPGFAPVAGHAPEWILFLTLALEHHVAGLAARAPGSEAPPPVRATLTAHAQSIAVGNQKALAEQDRLRTALNAAGVPFIPLKGAWLCLRAYRDLSARPSQDIDFLIPEADIALALPVLEACGYATEMGLSPRLRLAVGRNQGELIFFRRDNRFAIEPHWAFAPRNLALAVDHSAQWRRARAMTAGDLSFTTLASEDEFIMLCVHGGKEEWARLKWLADLAAFVIAMPALDWAAIAASAQSQGVRRMTLLGAMLLHDIFGLDTPLLASARAAPQVARMARTVIARMRHAATTARGPAVAPEIHRISRMRLAMRERPMDRLRYILRSIATPRLAHYRMIRLPDRLCSLYVGVKLIHDYALLPAWLAAKQLGLARRSAPGSD